jgi:hypothetical protein
MMMRFYSMLYSVYIQKELKKYTAIIYAVNDNENF